VHAKIDMRHACLSALALLRCFGKQIYRYNLIHLLVAVSYHITSLNNLLFFLFKA